MSPAICAADMESSPLTPASGCRVAGQWRGSLFSPLKCLQFSVFKKKLQVLAVVLASLSDNLDIEKSFALLSERIGNLPEYLRENGKN